MINELKKRGIEPMVTLHHFTDPVWLEDLGGWHGQEVVDRFRAYTDLVAKNLGATVRYWITINEPGSYLLMRYLGGGAWPEWPKIEMNPLKGHKYLKNVVKAHKAAAESLKKVNPEAMAGISHAIIDMQLGRSDPVSIVFRKILRYYPDTYLIKRLKSSYDFIGLNYYMRMKIKAGFKHPALWAPKWDGKDPRNDMGWGIYPDGIYNVTQHLKKYNLPIIITENGIPDNSDSQRGKFITDHLNALARSIADGADIRGYFYWSLLDNYEWSEGFWPRFGLVHVDRKTMKRTVRPSAKVYSDYIKNAEN